MFQCGFAPCSSPIFLWAATLMTRGINLGHLLLKLKSGCLCGHFDVLIPVFKISRRDFEPLINNLLKQGVLGVAQSPHISRHLVKMSENLTLIADKCIAWSKIYATSMHMSALFIPVLILTPSPPGSQLWSLLFYLANALFSLSSILPFPIPLAFSTMTNSPHQLHRWG